MYYACTIFLIYFVAGGAAWKSIRIFCIHVLKNIISTVPARLVLSINHALIPTATSSRPF